MSIRVALSIFAAVLLTTFGLVAQVKDARPLQVDAFRPVSEAMLRNPPPEDWLNWRGTDNNWGYSTLTQITKLKLANTGRTLGDADDDNRTDDDDSDVNDDAMRNVVCPAGSNVRAVSP